MLVRVLLVEDQPALVKALRQGMEEEGFAVDSAADGEEADVKARSTQYDVIVLDIMLPKVDGLTLLKRWRATEGPGREVFFAQKHVPGRLGQSDFTYMNELAITIGGQSFPHMLFHFVLTYSNWEDATICYSESFESLSEGLQERIVGTGRCPGGAPYRPALDGGEQHERPARVHQPLRSAAAALPDGGAEDPGRQSQ